MTGGKAVARVLPIGGIGTVAILACSSEASGPGAPTVEGNDTGPASGGFLVAAGGAGGSLVAAGGAGGSLVAAGGAGGSALPNIGGSSGATVVAETSAETVDVMGWFACRRKHARAGALPPVLPYWISGLDAHVVLDGHDRLLAAVLEDVPAPALSLELVTERHADESRKAAALSQVAKAPRHLSHPVPTKIRNRGEMSWNEFYVNALRSLTNHPKVV